MRGEQWPPEDLATEPKDEDDKGPNVHCDDCDKDAGYYELLIAAAERRKTMLAASFRRPATEAGHRLWWRNGSPSLSTEHHAYTRERARTAGTPYRAAADQLLLCLLYTSPSPRDATLSRMPSSA